MKIEQFLEQSYTAYHAVHNARAMLDNAGFREISPTNIPALRAGDAVYTIWGGTSLFAFKIGQEATVMLAECHTDSPALRVKTRETIPSPEGYRLNVEMYGGLLPYSMLDIPLKVAGRLTVETAEGVRTRLVHSEQNLVIPSLCIHHNPDANNLTLNVQKDMLPLVGDVKDVYRYLAPDETVLDADLFVVPAVTPYRAGANNEYLCSPRIDNLTSVYAAVEGIIHAQPKGTAVIACFDNEEIGSGTKRGAASTLLSTLIADVLRASGYDNPMAALASGLALSVDNGHALHPAHPEKSDVVDAPVLGGGVVVKHHVNYATDGLSAGLLKRILDKAGVPHQDYYNRSDIRCGSTLGNIAARTILMDTVDIGIAELAMHSAVETAAGKDVDTICDAIRITLGSTLVRRGDAIDVVLP